ncbi:MAG: FkbM family methyltransferase [Bacillaceae bacterium]|nr:FkbM family methyltransferase [Bacillaceae bacterium]
MSKKIIIFGTGKAAELILEKISFHSILYYIDNDKKKWNSTFSGKYVYPPKKLLEESEHEIIILVASMYYQSISQQLKGMGFIEEKDFFHAESFIQRNKISKKSFSQNGEDIIINYILQRLGIKRISFLDIGSNHPVIDNNTFYFYSNGNTGVCIEPNTEYNHLYSMYRQDDILINALMGEKDTGDKRNYYYMDNPGYNTVFIEQRREFERLGHQVKKQCRLPVIDVNEVIQEYLEGKLNFLSIDVEGAEIEVLNSLKVEKYGPEVMCVETIYFSNTGIQQKKDDLINLVCKMGYSIVADTLINTIFLKKGLM